jgi:hypothetical protein
LSQLELDHLALASTLLRSGGEIARANHIANFRLRVIALRDNLQSMFADGARPTPLETKAHDADVEVACKEYSSQCVLGLMSHYCVSCGLLTCSSKLDRCEALLVECVKTRRQKLVVFTEQVRVAGGCAIGSTRARTHAHRMIARQ